MELEKQYQLGFPDINQSTNDLAILCDNAYRRVSDSSCGAHLPVNIDGSGNLMRVSTTHIDAGNFRPDSVPVSYTHLDVYKRQGMMDAAVSMTASLQPAHCFL